MLQKKFITGYHKLPLAPIEESSKRKDYDYAILLAGPFKFPTWLEYTLLLMGLV